VNVHRGFIGTRWRNSNYGVPLQSKGGGDHRIVDCSCSMTREVSSGIGQYKKEPCYPLLLQTNLPFKLIPPQTEKPPLSVLPQDTSRYKAFESKSSSTMAPTPIQENLVESNKKYVGQLHAGPPRSPTSKEICRLYDSSPPFSSRPTSR
jgi:hypothetical protein